MNRAVASQFRRAGIEPEPGRPALASRWYGRIGFCLLSAVLLTAAFPPFDQSYFAWVGLVPFFLVLRSCKSQPAAFFWAWLAGVFFCSANLWWLYGVTSIGTPVLMGILGLYWGLGGMILRGSGAVAPIEPAGKPLSRLARVRRLAIVRVGITTIIFYSTAEWLLGNWPWNGLPWLPLGYSQIPFRLVCQIGDLFGVTGLSLLIIAVNAWVAMWVGHRLNFRGLRVCGWVLLALIAADIGYGIYREKTEPKLWSDGPQVLVVQSNFKQHNDGSKGATPEDLVNFHLSETEKALAVGGPVDLVAWSETVMPPLGSGALSRLIGQKRLAEILDSPVPASPPASVAWTNGHDEKNWPRTRLAIRDLANDFDTAVITGGLFVTFVPDEDGEHLKFGQMANVAYSFDRRGDLDPIDQKKIHLVPFGEYVPFKDSFPPMYRLLLRFCPKDMADYALTPGTETGIHHFTLDRVAGDTRQPWKFATPICFEDIDGALCATMTRPTKENPGEKQADFLVNMTNDGWFAGQQNRQHFVASQFRAIENRVPVVRSVNTGISGFIDPLGRGYGQVPARTLGTSSQRLRIDPRVTLYTRTGPALAQFCAVITLGIAIGTLVRWIVGMFKRGRTADGFGRPPITSAAV